MPSWLFQGNPESFDIEGYLSAVEVAVWTVRQRHLAKRMGSGDRVFFWRAGAGEPRHAGIVAAGWMESEPQLAPLDDAAIPYQRGESFSAPELRVRVKVERVADGHSRLRREWLKEDPILADMRIMHLAAETNYPLSDAHAERLEKLWTRTGRDWSPDEALAGLWAYARTLGGEISRRPGSHVSDVAILLGRAVSSVYNKVMNFRAIDERDPRKGFSATATTDRAVWSQYFDATTKQLDVSRLNADYERVWLGVVPPPAGPGTRKPQAPPADSGEQGYEPNPLIRKRVEDHAVQRAAAHYKGLGYAVESVGDSESYDLRCLRPGEQEVRVEVKGTRGSGKAIILTTNEVEHAREAEGYRVDLYVVSKITIAVANGEVSADGGEARLLEDWAPEAERLTATQYRYRVPTKEEREP